MNADLMTIDEIRQEIIAHQDEFAFGTRYPLPSSSSSLSSQQGMNGSMAAAGSGTAAAAGSGTAAAEENSFHQTNNHVHDGETMNGHGLQPLSASASASASTGAGGAAGGTGAGAGDVPLKQTNNMKHPFHCSLRPIQKIKKATTTTGPPGTTQSSGGLRPAGRPSQNGAPAKPTKEKHREFPKKSKGNLFYPKKLPPLPVNTPCELVRHLFLFQPSP